MKFTALLVLSLFHFSSTSQVSKGHVQFAIDVEAIDTSQQTKQMVGMFFDSNMKLYFTKTNSRVDYKMGRLYTATVVINSQSDSALVLQAGPMGNFAKYQPSADFAKSKSEPGAVEVKRLDEYKTILGYKCQKIIYTNNGNSVDYWITNEIQLSQELGQDIVNPDLPGFPLEFSASDGSVLFHYIASNIQLEIPNEEVIFSINVPEGFKLMPQ